MLLVWHNIIHIDFKMILQNNEKLELFHWQKPENKGSRSDESLLISRAQIHMN
jgi:hypothetical protein